MPNDMTEVTAYNESLPWRAASTAASVGRGGTRPSNSGRTDASTKWAESWPWFSFFSFFPTLTGPRQPKELTLHGWGHHNSRSRRLTL